jgi:hypothetical protein
MSATEEPGLEILGKRNNAGQLETAAARPLHVAANHCGLPGQMAFEEY